MKSVLCEEMIGRDDAMDAVRDALQSVASSQGRLLFVTGEAGIGKSRLIRETVAMARERGFQVLFGRAVPAEVPVPFRPIVGALLSYSRTQAPLDAPELAPFRPALGRLLPERRFRAMPFPSRSW